MKKKLVTLAVASTLATAAMVSAPAFADTSNVTVYGVANVSYDLTNTGSGTGPTSANAAAVTSAGFSSNKVSSNTSRLGLKGSEDLGDGLSAVWQLEQLIAIDNSGAGNGLATRNTFAGLSSASMGTVLLGRHDTPYKLATRGMDYFGDTIADNRAIMGGGLNTLTSPATNGGVGLINLTTGAIVANGNSTGAAASFDGRQTDVIAYVSPAMSGFTGIIAYVAGAEGQTLATQSKGSAWSLAGLYGNGPLTANFAYEVHDIGGAPGTVGAPALGALAFKESAWKIGVGYTMDAFTINGVYEKTQDNFGAVVGLPAGADVLGHRNYYLSGKYSFGNDAVKLAYANAGDLACTGCVSTGAKQWSIGYDHNLSKRTTVFALYTQLSNDTNGSYALGNAGVGNGSVYVNGTGGTKPSAVSLGMKHTF